jgi:hypothetical protein
MLDLDVPLARVVYRFRQIDGPALDKLVKKLI